MEAGYELFCMIENYSGLTLNQAHKVHVTSFLEKRLKALNLTEIEYLDFLKKDSSELANLINESTINETYFFREEKQFNFLLNWFTHHANEKIKIWSAACSTGEEAISIYTLCKSRNIDAKIIATDIDTNALKKFEEGIYYKNSFREDGKLKHFLLNSLGQFKDGIFYMDKNCIAEIEKKQFNLTAISNLPVEVNSIDIIFLRNVFIYFDEKLRKQILKNMWNALKPDGILLTSINEIASIDCSDVDLLYKKENIGDVFFLRKISFDEKKILIEKEIADKNKFEQINKQEIVYKKKSDEKISTSNETKIAQTLAACEKNIPDDTKKFCKKILDLIDINKTDDAKKELDAKNFLPQEAEYKYYFEGIICFKNKNYNGAKENLFKSTVLNGNFWPAHFGLAQTYMQLKNQKESRMYFQKAQELLEHYISNEKTCYNFIVRSFSASYFLELCKTNLKEMET